MEQSEKREQKAREEKEIEVSSIGKAFVKGTHVEFTYHRHRFTGVIEKQLRNSAISTLNLTIRIRQLISNKKLSSVTRK